MAGSEFLFTHECHHNIFQRKMPKNSQVKDITNDSFDEVVECFRIQDKRIRFQNVISVFLYQYFIPISLLVSKY
jgi:hypothetical protein